MTDAQVEDYDGRGDICKGEDNAAWMKKDGLSCDGRWIPMDDGHVPETFQCHHSSDQHHPSNSDNDHDSNSSINEPQQDNIERLLALYPEYVQERLPTLRVHDHFVPQHVVSGIYETTRQDKQPWGTYVTVRQVRQYWEEQQRHRDIVAMDSDVNNHEQITTAKQQEDDRDHLALLAAEAFFRAALSEDTASLNFVAQKDGAESKFVEKTKPSTTTPTSKTDTPLWTKADMDRCHGVAVWALGATEKSQVTYHLDYAEQVRYETNRIVPPALAGTLQCTPTEIRGGDYCAHVGGLEHYERYGYKGIKDPNHNVLDTLDDDPGWIRVPYKHNRLTIQSGHLPHLSTPIESIGQECQNDSKPASSNNNKENEQNNPHKRVILGFNVFFPDIGHLVQRAPEHSPIFRRKVALQRWLLSKTRNNNNNNSTIESAHYSDGMTTALSSSKPSKQLVAAGGMNLSNIRANPALSKLLVLAKRQKVKHEFRQRQAELDRSIQRALASGCIVLVQDLMDRLGRRDGQFPSPTDVQVHLHHGQLQGKFAVVEDGRTTLIASSDKPDQSYLSPESTIQLVANS